MPKQDEEVKEFDETSKVDDSDDSEEKEDDESSDDSEKDEEETKDDSDDSKEKDTQSESSSDENQSSDDESKEDDESEKEEPKEVDGETPREKALRLEVERLKQYRRDDRSKELFSKDDAPVKKKEISDDKKERLKKYDPKEIENLREVLDVMADDMGFVKKDEYQKSSYSSQAKDILDDFLENHPEYTPENDKGDVLWKRFQSEYSLYKLPESPRDLKKLFNKIHNDVVGIKPSSDLKKIEAKKEKLDAASHSASKNKQTKKTEQLVDRSSGSVDKETVRKGLKGFTDEEIDELLG